MTIQGLENNNYLINNEIVVIITVADAKYVDVELTNNYNQKVGNLRLYAHSDEIRFDVSKAIKSLFDYPNFYVAKNMNNISIKFTLVQVDNTISVQTITKDFIRGGVFNRESNNYVPNNFNIDLAIQGAYIDFTSYFKKTYYLITDGAIQLNITNNKTTIENGCKGRAVRFLNQYGGYSHWYFNFFNIKTNSKDFEQIVRLNNPFTSNNHFTDVGVSLETEIEFRGNVPLQYNELMKHLIASPEVYMLAENEQWQRIKQKGNKQYYDSREKNYKYKFDFALENVNNPSLLW